MSSTIVIGLRGQVAALEDAHLAKLVLLQQMVTDLQTQRSLCSGGVTQFLRDCGLPEGKDEPIVLQPAYDLADFTVSGLRKLLALREKAFAAQLAKIRNEAIQAWYREEGTLTAAELNEALGKLGLEPYEAKESHFVTWEFTFVAPAGLEEDEIEDALETGILAAIEDAGGTGYEKEMITVTTEDLEPE